MTTLLSITLFLVTPPPSETIDSAILVEQLASCEALAQCAPARTLVTRGKAAVPALLKGLDHPKELVRFWVCGVLSEIHPKAAFKPLLERFQNDPKLRVRNAALYALGSLKDPRSIQPLTRAMKHKDPNVRIAGMMGLSMLKSKDTTEVIRQAIRDRDEEVRAMAMITLGDMQVNDAFNEIALRLKEDIKASVRAAACVALAGLGNDTAVDVISAAVRSDRNLRVRAECAASLGHLGSKKALPVLQSVVQEEDPLGGAAKWAIGQIKKTSRSLPTPKT